LLSNEEDDVDGDDEDDDGADDGNDDEDEEDEGFLMKVAQQYFSLIWKNIFRPMTTIRTMVPTMNTIIKFWMN